MLALQVCVVVEWATAATNYFFILWRLWHRFSYFVSHYGSGSNFDSATYERLHQEVVVRPVKHDARREEGMLGRLLTHVDSMTLLRTHMSPGM